MKITICYHAHKGEPGSLILEEPIPDPPSGFDWKAIWQQRLAVQADAISAFLIDHLPGGVLCQVTSRLLHHQANLLAIASPTPPKEDVPTTDL